MPFALHIADEVHELDIVSRRPELLVRLDGRIHTLADGGATGSLRTIIVDGHSFTYAAALDQNAVHLHFKNRIVRVNIPDPRDAFNGEGGGANDIVAPMPGTVVSIARKQGDKVAAGEIILTIESMKLQMNLSAQRQGCIARIAVQPNATFNKGDLLVALELEDKG